MWVFFLHSENGASSYPCDEIYAGEEPFSEPENRHIRDFANANKEQIKLYLTFHSYGEVRITVSILSVTFTHYIRSDTNFISL
jgi:hypothetical protein